MSALAAPASRGAAAVRDSFLMDAASASPAVKIPTAIAAAVTVLNIPARMPTLRRRPNAYVHQRRQRGELAVSARLTADRPARVPEVLGGIEMLERVDPDAGHVQRAPCL